ncbi:HEAT repeats [uncultured archaeon]|nr:HEAT repeats [uncultured archaeon]
MLSKGFDEVMAGDRTPLKGISVVDELVPPLLEAKARPAFMQDRIRLVRMLLGEEQFNSDFIIQQLGNRDLVNRMGALYAVGGEKNIPDENKQRLADKIETLAKDSDRDIRRAAATALGNLGEKALPILQTLLKDTQYVRQDAITALGAVGEKALPTLILLALAPNWLFREPAIKALGKVGNEALPTLSTLAEDPEGYVRVATAAALGNVGGTAVPTLVKLAEDSEGHVRRAAATALGNLGKEALPPLSKLAEDPEDNVRVAVATALGNVGEEAIPTLAKLAQDPYGGVHCTAIESLGRIGERAIPTLVQLAQDHDLGIRCAVARSLGAVGGQALHELEKLTEDPVPDVSSVAKTALAEKKADKKPMLDLLIGLGEPALASPFLRETEGRLQALADISARLTEEFGSGYVGVVIVGSTEKGYMTPQSDLDCAIIAENLQVKKEFVELAEAREIHPCIRLNLPPDTLSGDNRNFLFTGMFFGNREKLAEMQKKTLDSLTPEDWDTLRKTMINRDVDFYKLYKGGLKYEDIELIEHARTVLYTPPDYETMKTQVI